MIPLSPSRPSLSFPFCGTFSNGGSDVLATKYAGMVAPQARPGHNVTIVAELENPSVPAEQLLKR